MKSKQKTRNTSSNMSFKILIFILIVVLIGFGILLTHTYRELTLSIQNERVKSVEQIGLLLSDKVNHLKESYIKDTEQMAGIITGSCFHTKEELLHIFPGDNQFLLVSEDGRFQALDGESWLIEDNGLRENVLHGSGVQSSFASDQTKGDYWLFSVGIAPIEIDGRIIVGVVKPVSTQEYADVATLALFEGLGAAYVINNEGIIIMRPKTVNTLEAFNGYNLFNILKQEQVPESDVNALRTAIQTQTSYQMLAEIDEITWLVQSVPGDAGRGIVIAVPISITARDTYAGMRYVTLLISITVLLLGTIVLLTILLVLKRNQKAEIIQGKIKAKNDFLDKMSHDIRTPLNAIIGMHEMALRSLDNQAALADYLNKAKRSSEYLVSIINDMLDMSKIESGKMTVAQIPFSMRELLDHVYQMEVLSTREKKQTFTLDIQTPINTDYVGDPVRLRQCLMNLVSNAMKFTPEDGSIQLGYLSEPMDDGCSLVTMWVKDSGTGMSEDFRDRLFQPFEQENSSMTNFHTGSGLGLAIVKNLVELMGGDISVESQLGKGSTFTLRLPLPHSVMAQAEKESDEADLTSRIKGRRILFVEDNLLNREIGVNLLEQIGLLVDSAENGKVAVEAFERSEAGCYSLIFMDIQMPIMNGYDATRRIRASSHPDAKSIPILALSANAFDEDARKSLDAGMQGHLAKPIDMTELTKALKKHIR